MIASYIGANQFSVSGDHTLEFIYGRGLSADCGTDGIKYTTISSSYYSSPSTYVTISESVLSPGLTDVLYGIQIFTDSLYVYAVTSSGLDIISIDTEDRICFIQPVGYVFTTVWADDDAVFLGTSVSGIKVLNKYDIEVEPSIYDFVSYPDITNNNVSYLHGNNRKMACCTDNGVSLIRLDTGYITKTFVAGAKKCFVTPNYNYCYYTVEASSYWSINKLINNTTDWTTPSIYYRTGEGFLTSVTCLLDFYVTEHTSLSGVNNTLFLATDNGVYVFDEGTRNYNIYTTVSGT